MKTGLIAILKRIWLSASATLKLLVSFSAAKLTKFDVQWRVGIACFAAFIVLLSIFCGLLDSELMVVLAVLSLISALRFIVVSDDEISKV
jgi:hypothetical protein